MNRYSRTDVGFTIYDLVGILCVRLGVKNWSRLRLRGHSKRITAHGGGYDAITRRKAHC